MYWRLCGPFFIKSVALKCSVYDWRPVEESDIAVANICLNSAGDIFPRAPKFVLTPFGSDLLPRVARKNWKL